MGAHVPGIVSQMTSPALSQFGQIGHDPHALLTAGCVCFFLACSQLGPKETQDKWLTVEPVNIPKCVPVTRLLLHLWLLSALLTPAS